MAKTVLVIDDDEMVADVVRIALTAEGYDVVHAPNTDAGITVLDERTPDLVLLDGSFPTPSTWSLLDRLGDGDQPVPVIVMAKRTMPADQVRAYNLGAAAYVTKPVQADDVVEKVRQAVGG